jgi:hypothetical protein
VRAKPSAGSVEQPLFGDNHQEIFERYGLWRDEWPRLVHGEYFANELQILEAPPLSEREQAELLERVRRELPGVSSA